jgi:preprotein translocase subunit SecG
MYGLIIGLTIFAAILLILVVLVQKPKGGGLASQFSSSNLAFGVKRTSDFIEKATWGLAIAIIVLSMSSNFFVGGDGSDGVGEAINRDQLDNIQVNPSNTGGPQLPAGQQQPTP